MGIKTKYLPTRKSYKKSILVIVLFILIYFLDITPLRIFIGSFKYIYILKPIVWVIMSCIIWTMPHIKPNSKLKYRRLIIFWAFNLSLIYIFITFFAGIVAGFGKSPYDHSPRGIIINIVFVGTFIIGREFIRSFLINNLTKKENYLIFIGIAFLMTVANYPIYKYMELNSLQRSIKFLAEYFLPELSHSIFASYLVFLGGPGASIIYLGVIQAFNWLSPILPNLKWIITALIGVLCPAFFMMLFQFIYLSSAKLIKKRHQEDKSSFSWILVSIVSIILIWFTVGVFPIYPSVIATGSMEPIIYPGDVILVDKITNIEGIKSLKVDDIIQFRRGQILISHRIIEIRDDKVDGLLFATKGDNNSSVDKELVKPQDIIGKVEHVIPKIGWPTLLIKSDKDIFLDEIIF